MTPSTRSSPRFLPLLTSLPSSHSWKRQSGYLLNSFWHESTRFIEAKLSVIQTILRRLKQQNSSMIHRHPRPHAGKKKANGNR